MKILIVGHLGMLGADLMKSFPADEVSGLDLPDIDIRDPDLCIARVCRVRPDVLINSAALTAVDYCESHADEAFQINGEGAGNLARAGAVAGARFIHYSTDYVFDGQKTEPYCEEDAPNPLSVYGRSKLRAEELVRQNCENHLILRTSWLFGPNGRNFIRTIVNAAREGRALRVVDDQRGSPCYTVDLAAHTAMLCRSESRGTYHLTNSGWCTWFQLACKALEFAGAEPVSLTPVTTAEFPVPAPRPQNSVLENARLKRESFPLMRSWQEAAEEYILGSLSLRSGEAGASPDYS